jgi:hypothetical protein
MISNVSGFVLNSTDPFYISETRPLGTELTNPQEVVVNEVLPFDLVVSIRRIGWVEFDFSGWTRTKAVPEPNDGEPIRFNEEWKVTKLRLLLMNVFLSIFYTQYEKIHQTNLPKNVITSKDQITRTDLESPNIGFGSQQGFNHTSISNEPQRGFTTWVVPKVIEKTIEEFRIMLGSNEKFWSLIENLAVAHLNHQNNHFSQSVGISWTVIESILALTWNEKAVTTSTYKKDDLREAIKKHNDQKFKGTDPKRYSSKVMTDVLAELSIIDNSKKDKLHSIRISRNDWIHELKDIDMLVSNDAINVAIDLLNVLMPINISWNANTSWYSG